MVDYMEDKTLNAEQTTQVLAYTACDLPWCTGMPKHQNILVSYQVYLLSYVMAKLRKVHCMYI